MPVHSGQSPLRETQFSLQIRDLREASLQQERRTVELQPSLDRRVVGVVEVNGKREIQGGRPLCRGTTGEVTQHAPYRRPVHRAEQAGQIALEPALEGQHRLLGQHIGNLTIDDDQRIACHSSLAAGDLHHGAVESQVNKGCLDLGPPPGVIKTKVLKLQARLKKT